jgi:uncharacterized protein with HEPN domain
MKKDPTVYIEHILESIAQIEEYTQNISEEEFFYDIKAQDAVFRRLEVVGEASKRIPAEVKNQFPNIEWKEAMGMRDIIIHNYNEIDPHIIWKTVQEDIPKLKKEVLKLQKYRVKHT